MWHVYVSNARSAWFSHFLLDSDRGALLPMPDIPLAGSPGAVATSADGRRLFVCLRSLQRFASYAVDGASGALAPIDSVSLADGAPYLATDRSDRFLLAAYYGSGHVSVHGIGADGMLSAEPLQWLATAPHAHSIQTDRTNRFAFVPHTLPTNAIYQFRFDARTGALQPNDPPLFRPATPEGPRHFVFHPHADLLYSVNEDNSTVTAHRLDAERGTLAAVQTISTLPAGEWPGNTTAEIAISPDGRFLYASNRGHDSLAVFAVAADGTLSPRGHAPTEPTPRFFALDPTANFLLSAGQQSGRVALYRRDAASGALALLGTYPVGASPLWIAFVAQR